MCREGKIFLISLVINILVFCAICNDVYRNYNYENSISPNVIDFDMKKIINQIIKEKKLKKLYRMNQKEIIEMYDISENDNIRGIISTSLLPLSIDEVAIFYVTDENKYEQIISKINKRKIILEGKYDENSEEYICIHNSKPYTKDKYVIFVIDNNKENNIINENNKISSNKADK